MSFNLNQLLEDRRGENLKLHQEHINPQFAKVLKTIGFDVPYLRGEGAYLYDANDRRVIDFLSGYGVFNIGRNHPKVADALKQLLDSEHPALVQMEAPLLSGVLAEKLKALVPSELNKVFFTNSGTEGVETAIKFARSATGRSKIIHCDHSFHGLSTGSLSLNGGDWFRESFGELLDSQVIPFNDIEALETALKDKTVAGFIVEPIQGKTVKVAEDSFLQQAQKLCEQHGTLLIIDEVQSGYCRSGKMFAMEFANIVPDVLVTAKALSGGYIPVGAVLTKDWIYKKVFSSMDRCVVHSSTFGQNNAAMVAGIATLEVLQEENLAERAQQSGERLMSGLNKLVEKYQFVDEVRGRGLMVGIEFKRPKSLKLKMAWDLVHKVNDGLFGQAIVIPLLSDHGILTQVAGRDEDIIKLIPPLTLTEEDIDYFVECFDQVLASCNKFPGPIWEVATRLTKIALTKR